MSLQREPPHRRIVRVRRAAHPVAVYQPFRRRSKYLAPYPRFIKGSVKSVPDSVLTPKSARNRGCAPLNASNTVFVNKVSETSFLPPSIPSKWRGLRGLEVQSRVRRVPAAAVQAVREEVEAEGQRRERAEGLVRPRVRVEHREAPVVRGDEARPVKGLRHGRVPGDGHLKKRRRASF